MPLPRLANRAHLTRAEAPALEEIAAAAKADPAFLAGLAQIIANTLTPEPATEPDTGDRLMRQIRSGGRP